MAASACQLSRALKLLAAEKAPRAVTQMVLWNVAAGLDWADIARLSQGWANAHELALARQVVQRLQGNAPDAKADDPGVLYWEVKTVNGGSDSLCADVRGLFEKHGMLGLTTQKGVPTRPAGPAVACRIELNGAKARVYLGSTDAAAAKWVSAGSFDVKLPEVDKADEKALKLADAIAGGIVVRLVRVQLSKGPKVKGKETYRVRIDNASPLVLNGLALAGPDEGAQVPPAYLDAMSLPPHRSFTVPATGDVVERLHWKEGIRVVAANLSGL